MESQLSKKALLRLQQAAYDLGLESCQLGSDVSTRAMPPWSTALLETSLLGYRCASGVFGLHEGVHCCYLAAVKDMPYSAHGHPTSLAAWARQGPIRRTPLLFLFVLGERCLTYQMTDRGASGIDRAHPTHLAFSTRG